MTENTELTLQELKKIDRQEDLEAVQRIVSNSIPQLTAAALASAIGGTVLLKLTQSETGKMKYVPVNTTEEILQGIEWIAEYGNKFDQEGFYMLQQRPPDAKFWDMLASRHLGKVPDEAKKDTSDKLNLAAIGKKAIERHTAPKTESTTAITDPIPSSWT